MVSPIPSISGSEVEAIRPKPKADEFSPRSPVMGLLGAPLGLTLVTMMLLAGRSEGMVDAAYTNSHWSSPTFHSRIPMDMMRQGCSTRRLQ